MTSFTRLPNVFLAFSLLPMVTFSFFEKFDVAHIPSDLLPVKAMVGRWELYTMTGKGMKNIPFGTNIEFGIDPLPLFGARSLNYTGIAYDHTRQSTVGNGSFVTHYESGFLLVNNKSRTNPQIQCSFLTSTSEGYTMTEFGLVESPQSVKLDLNKYMTRSFDLNFPGGQFQIYELERQFTMSEHYLLQTINSRTSYGISEFTATYIKRNKN